jgi:hypothetical protein
MEYIMIFIYTVFDSFILDSRTAILIGVLLYSALKPQAMIFSVIEAICIAVSAIDLLITGSAVSAVVLALLLGPRIPLVYVCILCAALSIIDYFTGGGIASIIVAALAVGHILMKKREHLTFSFPFTGVRIYKTIKKKRSLAVILFLMLWLFHGVEYVASSFWEDEASFVRNFLYITQSIGRFVTEHAVHPEAFPESKSVQEKEEREFHKIEDPDGVKLLWNNFAAYDRAEQFAERRKNTKETIELRVTPSKIQPGRGGRVYFEAIPSSETPALGSSIMLFSNNLNYTTSLSRQWLSKKYSGSVKFKTTDTGVYRFGFTTDRYDGKIKKIINYNSNSVSVVVAPESDRLSRIFIEAGIAGVVVAEDSTVQLGLYGEGHKGEIYDISMPEIGTQWTVEDESKAIVTEEKSYDGNTYVVLKGMSLGKTRLRVKYGSLEAQADVSVFRAEPIPTKSIIPGVPPPPPPAERPNPVSPPDGYVARLGERVQLEATSFDSSLGYTFKWSSWSVYKINPDTGLQGPEVAAQRNGNSENAEWIPKGVGTFEWEVIYFYSTGQRTTDVKSFPQRIVVVE